MKTKKSLAVALFIAAFLGTAIFVNFPSTPIPQTPSEESVIEEEEGEIGLDSYSGQALIEIARANGELVDITEGDDSTFVEE